MSRHEFKNLSAASRAMVDQTTRKEIWEAAACEDLTALAAASSPEIADRFDHWLAVGETYFDGPAPLDGLIACLRRCHANEDDASASTLGRIIAAYDEVTRAGRDVLSLDVNENRLVALMDRDRFAEQRIKAQVLALWRHDPETPLAESFQNIVITSCEGLPRLCSPGR